MSAYKKTAKSAVIALAAVSVLFIATPAHAALGDVGAADFLGPSAAFTVLAGSTVTNTGASYLPGSLGVSPGSALTGFTPEMIGGATHSNDGVAITAKGAVGVAADALMAVPSYDIGLADMDGKIFVAGSYSSPSSLLNGGTIILNGDADDVFIFTAVSTLTTGAGSTVVLTGGAQECNVFWRLGSAGTIGAGSHLVGTVIARSSISVTTGATIAGRLFAQDAAVTLQSNRFTTPTCDTSEGNGSIWGAGEDTGTEPAVVPPTESTDGPTGPVLPIPEDETEEENEETGNGNGSGEGGGTDGGSGGSSGSGAGGGASGAGGSLAATGSDILGPLAAGGAALLASLLGVGALVVTQRRRAHHNS